MRILVVSPFLPFPGVPHAGGKLVLHLLRTLAQRHQVSLVARHFPGEERHAAALKELLFGLELVAADGPLRGGSLASAASTIRSYARLARAAEAACRRERFDLCQVEYTESGLFWRAPAGLPTVLTCHDIKAKPAFRRYASSGGLSRLAAWAAWKLWYAVEKRSIAKFGMVFVLSDEDREWAARLYPTAMVKVLRYPGGIDFDNVERAEIPGRILFVGALNRQQNVEAVDYFFSRVWPHVRNGCPGAEFRVVGGGAPESLRRTLSSDRSVTMTGYIERVDDEYRAASLFAAPILSGGGVIVKILDAMAAGIPVVTTSYGNEGIRANPGSEILVSDDPQSMAREIVRLLGDVQLRAGIGAAGKRYVEGAFSAAALEAALSQAYEALLERTGHPA